MGPQPAGVSQGSFSYTANLQSPRANNDVDVIQEREAMSSTLSVPHAMPQVAQATSVSNAFSIPSNAATINVPPPPSYQVLPGFSNSPIASGPPGISPSTLLPAKIMITPQHCDFSSAFPRPVVQAPHFQHAGYSLHQSIPPLSSSSQGGWLQPTQVSGPLRQPFSPYPAAFTGAFPYSARSTPVPSVPSSDPQPPGVTGAGVFSENPITASQSTTSALQLDIPPGIDNSKHVKTVDVKDESSTREQLAWSAHRTETGAVYYYNSLTGESTYEKPSCFNGEAEKVTAHPTPVSWEKLDGTDWALVTTNDGKRYYYNMKTKLSSWQIPAEVSEGKNKDGDVFKTQSMSVSSTDVLTEKGSTPVTLCAPAANTGGRDATVLRSSSVVSSSALDLIKKKLQDPGATPNSPGATLPVAISADLNGSKLASGTVRDPETEISKDKIKDANGEINLSEDSSESDDDDNGPTKEECIIQFKEMLKERGVAPFSKWEKELPKLVFDPRFKAIPNHSARRALFEHYVRNRAEEERKEKRAAQKAAVEGFKKLLEDAKEQIDHHTDYHTFKKQWGHDERFLALDRKERESLLNERILPLKRAAEEKAQAVRAATVSSFKSMLKEKGNITLSSRWSKVKDSFRDDPRYKSVKHEDKEALFEEYISELKAAEEEIKRAVKEKNNEEEKLRERERELRKRKEREEKEVERVRSKVRRKVAVESFQALLVEIIKDPQATWTDSKPRLEKDSQGRAVNSNLGQSDLEKLFREHVKILQERSMSDFRALLAEFITAEAAAQEKDGKSILTSWSTAKQLLKPDPRYAKVPSKDRETLWKRHTDEIQRRQKLSLDKEGEKHTEGRKKSSDGSDRHFSGSRAHDRR